MARKIAIIEDPLVFVCVFLMKPLLPVLTRPYGFCTMRAEWYRLFQVRSGGGGKFGLIFELQLALQSISQSSMGSET